MYQPQVTPRSKLDPYVASSLLQKSIRRGHIEAALRSCSELYRHRGKGVWRRLLIIAYEDIGIANLSLVTEITEAAGTRSTSLEEMSNLEYLVTQLALSVKSRTADHVYCAAELHAIEAHGDDDGASNPAEIISHIADPAEPLIRRLRRLLYGGSHVPLTPAIVSQHLMLIADSLPANAGRIVKHSIDASRQLRNSFPLVLPLIAASLEEDSAPTLILNDELPDFIEINGIPSYAFDKHTWAGKRATSRLAIESDAVKSVLTGCVHRDYHAAATGMAAFYADAAPVDKRLVWSRSERLEALGFEADMTSAGCPATANAAVLEAVKDNLWHLDEIRMSIVDGRAAQCKG